MKTSKHRLVLKIVYVLLVALALYRILTHGLDSPFLKALLKGEADPFGFMMFTLMGLYPLSFLLSNFILKRDMTLTDKILSGLSFAFGAFTLVPSYFKPYVRKERPDIVRITFIVWACLGSTLMIMVYGLMLGDTSLFFEAFFKDTLIHIMTLDFLTLTFLSVLIASEHTRFWHWTLIPLIGWWAILLD